MQSSITSVVMAALLALAVGVFVVVNLQSAKVPEHANSSDSAQSTAQSQTETQSSEANQESLIFDNIPEVPARILEQIAHYENLESTSLVGWSPDGKGIFSLTENQGLSQLHFIENPNFDQRTLTSFVDGADYAYINPNPKAKLHLVAKDEAGNGKFNLFGVNPRTKKTTLLFDHNAPQIPFLLWSPDGDRFVFASNVRNNRNIDIYLINANRLGQVERLYEGGQLYPLDWTLDGKELLVWDQMATTNHRINILNLESGELRMAQRRLPWNIRTPRFSADGKGIYYTLNSDYWRLNYYDIEARKASLISVGITGDVQALAMSPDRSQLAFSASRGGLSELYLLDTDTNIWERLRGTPQGIYSSLRFSPDGTQLAFVVDNAQAPRNIHVLNLDGREITKWTNSQSDALNPDHFPLPTLIEYPSFDILPTFDEPRAIPAFYYKPTQGEGPFPVLIYIHDGPSSQFVPRYDPSFQYFLNELQVAIIAPNVRGSSGYDEVYRHMDNILKREDAVKDIEKLLDWIAKQPELDASRVIVMGESYGGYMALASLIYFGDRLRGGINLHGYSNFLTLLRNVPRQTSNALQFEFGNPRFESTVDFLKNISPLTNANRINTPLLVVHGKLDRIVPLFEVQRMVDIVRANRNDVWFLLANQESRRFAEVDNAKMLRAVTVMFLEKYLLPRQHE
jgi:dipeptidyl aminopeptidase/acylaminoacyl peptidase